jgi:hypothetical protein
MILYRSGVARDCAVGTGRYRVCPLHTHDFRNFASRTSDQERPAFSGRSRSSLRRHRRSELREFLRVKKQGPDHLRVVERCRNKTACYARGEKINNVIDETDPESRCSTRAQKPALPARCVPDVRALVCGLSAELCSEGGGFKLEVQHQQLNLA